MIDYVPGPAPGNMPPEVQRYLAEEFRKIRESIAALVAQDSVADVAPSKPREGMRRVAKGTSWNPVAAGAPRFVGFRNGAWVLLG